MYDTLRMADSDLAARWGARITALRNERDFSLHRLARESDIDKAHLWKVEHGHAGLGDEARIRLAAALRVRVEDIFDYPDRAAS